jgi:hypothetical protein
MDRSRSDAGRSLWDRRRFALEDDAVGLLVVADEGDLGERRQTLVVTLPGEDDGGGRTLAIREDDRVFGALPGGSCLPRSLLSPVKQEQPRRDGA